MRLENNGNGFRKKYDSQLNSIMLMAPNQHRKTRKKIENREYP